MNKEEVKKDIVDFEDYVLPEYEESWIQGFPLKTNYGYIKPLKVKDYWKHMPKIDLLKKQGWEVINIILMEMKKTNNDDFDLVREDFKNNGFMTCLKNNVAGLRNAYDEIFSLMIYDFNPKTFYWKVNQVEFDELRKLILNFNKIPYHEKNPNPEIEKFNKMKNFVQAQKGGTIDFDTVFTSLMTKEGGGYLPDQINNLTLRQFYLAFTRIEYVKANEMTTLFKTVDSKGTIDVVDWNRSFREKDNEIVFNSLEELKESSNIFLKK